MLRLCPLAPSPSLLFWFLVLLAGACVRGLNPLALLLQCSDFGGKFWFGLFPSDDYLCGRWQGDGSGGGQAVG